MQKRGGLFKRGRMQGARSHEPRGVLFVRRAAKDEGNAADGRFSTARPETFPRRRHDPVAAPSAIIILETAGSARAGCSKGVGCKAPEVMSREAYSSYVERRRTRATRQTAAFQQPAQKMPRPCMTGASLLEFRLLYIGWTFTAAGPFLPCSISKPTRWPSWSVLKPVD